MTDETKEIKFYCASNRVADYISGHFETNKPIRIEVTPNGICFVRSSTNFLETCSPYLVGTESEGAEFKSQLTQPVNIVVADVVLDVMIDQRLWYNSKNFRIANIRIERFEVPSNVDIMKTLKVIEQRLAKIEKRLWPAGDLTNYLWQSQQHVDYNAPCSLSQTPPHNEPQ